MDDFDDNDSTDHYQGALLEEINERLKGIAEGQETLVNVPTDVAQLKEDMIVVKSDIKTLKFAVTDLSKELRGREPDWQSLKQR